MSVEDDETTLETPWKTDLLVCAATWMELRAWWPREEERSRLGGEQMAYSPALTFFLTGVGIPAALWNTLTLLQHTLPTRIWNIGIAGAYPNSGLRIGDIVIGTSETYGDVGFELPAEASGEPSAAGDPPGFQSIQSSPFLKQMPFAGELYGEPLPLDAELPTEVAGVTYQVRACRGCTVNTCTGTEQTGLRREQLFDVQFESMEGAAIAQCGKFRMTPVTEIRAISNFASTRDMQPDNIRLAIANLRDYLHYLQNFQRCQLSL
jgi:futalosine hydrolase